MAAPVSLASFFYSPICGLYVEINNTRYSRSSDCTLYDLLDLPPAHQDESTEFYLAQLQHYGMAPQESIQAAKKRLLAAFQGDGGLAVPKNILQLEKELVAEYRDNNAAGNEESRTQTPLQKKPNNGETKKRQRNEAESLAEMHAPSQKKSKLNEVSKPPTLRSAPSSMGTLVERRQDEEVESSTAEYGKQGQEGWGTTERLRGLWAYTIRALNGE